MTFNKYLLPFLFFVAICSCKQEPKKILPGTWYVTGIRNTTLDAFEKAMPVDLKQVDEVANSIFYSVVQGDYFRFYSNGSFTSFSGIGRFTYGNWWFDRNVIHLSMARRKDSMLLRVLELGASKIVVSSVITFGFSKRRKAGDTSADLRHPIVPDSMPIKLTLTKDKSAPPDEKDDFQTLENNRWRFQPEAPESREQIKQRVISMVRFSVLYLAAQIARKEGSVSIMPIKLPATIYAAGIRIDWAENIQPEWKALFYSDADAQVGYEIFRDAFVKRKYVPDKYGAELNLDILKQVLQNLQ